MQMSLSLSEIERERDELIKDRNAFTSAYDIVRARLLESSEMRPPRYPLLHEWSGSRAICGSFEMSIHAIERTIGEFDQLIEKIRKGEITNTDAPSLKLV